MGEKQRQQRERRRERGSRWLTVWTGSVYDEQCTSKKSDGETEGDGQRGREKRREKSEKREKERLWSLKKGRAEAQERKRERARDKAIVTAYSKQLLLSTADDTERTQHFKRERERKGEKREEKRREEKRREDHVSCARHTLAAFSAAASANADAAAESVRQWSARALRLCMHATRAAEERKRKRERKEKRRSPMP